MESYVEKMKKIEETFLDISNIGRRKSLKKQKNP